MPSKRQTRRSISIRGLTYQRLQDYCETEGVSMSGYMEDLITEKMDALGVAVPTEIKPRKPPEPPVAEDIVSQHFTF